MHYYLYIWRHISQGKRGSYGASAVAFIDTPPVRGNLSKANLSSNSGEDFQPETDKCGGTNWTWIFNSSGRCNDLSSHHLLGISLSVPNKRGGNSVFCLDFKSAPSNRWIWEDKWEPLDFLKELWGVWLCDMWQRRATLTIRGAAETAN